MNKFTKLVIKTVCEDLVCSYYNSGNRLVGSSLAARARLTVWSMKIRLNRFQTIADGCCFERNKVPFKQ